MIDLHKIMRYGISIQNAFQIFIYAAFPCLLDMEFEANKKGNISWCAMEMVFVVSMCQGFQATSNENDTLHI